MEVREVKPLFEGSGGRASLQLHHVCLAAARILRSAAGSEAAPPRWWLRALVARLPCGSRWSTSLSGIALRSVATAGP